MINAETGRVKCETIQRGMHLVGAFHGASLEDHPGAALTESGRHRYRLISGTCNEGGTAVFCLSSLNDLWIVQGFYLGNFNALCYTLRVGALSSIRSNLERKNEYESYVKRWFCKRIHPEYVCH